MTAEADLPNGFPLSEKSAVFSALDLANLRSRRRRPENENKTMFMV